MGRDAHVREEGRRAEGRGAATPFPTPPPPAPPSIREYAAYVDTLDAVESAPGCEACEGNRRSLEKVWQIVSQEFRPAPGAAFSQAAWAGRLRASLRAAGGVLKDEAALNAAASDLVASAGDRYTAFLPPAAYRAALRRPEAGELAYLTAQHGGETGIVLDGPAAAGAGARIAAVLAESAAEDAGLAPGDALLEVDGYRASRVTEGQLAAALRGPAGSETAVVVARASSPTLVRLALERRPAPQPPVKEAALVTPGGRRAAYIRLHFFSRSATDALAAALLRAAADGVDGVVLDLRNNPGGVFEEAIADAAMLVADGARLVSAERGPPGAAPLAYVSGALPPTVATPATLTGGLLPRGTRIVALINRGTASAAEVLAGALGDGPLPRATLLGERTFGKGAVQYYFPVTDAGAGVRVTVAAYKTPAGHDPTAERGLAPHAHCAGHPGSGLPDPEGDACVAAALATLDRGGRGEGLSATATARAF